MHGGNNDPERVHKEGGKEVHAGNIVAAAIDAEQVNGAAVKFKCSQHCDAPLRSAVVAFLADALNAA